MEHSKVVATWLVPENEIVAAVASTRPVGASVIAVSGAVCATTALAGASSLEPTPARTCIAVTRVPTVSATAGVNDQLPDAGTATDPRKACRSRGCAPVPAFVAYRRTVAPASAVPSTPAGET